MARPTIGICTSLERARFGAWDEPAALTPYAYVVAVQRAGGRAIMLPPDAYDEDHPDDVLDLLDGLILAGGVDVTPSVYGQEPGPHTVGTVPERDRFEISLARRALERDLPLLGICRGMQVLNVALGGTLVQHVPDVYGNDEHRRNIGTFTGNEHHVRLAPGSLAAEAAGEERHTTRSHHHQAIDEVGAGLMVTGWSEVDGLPEAVEIPDRRFVLGVQWHPEADEASHVIDAFVREAAGAAIDA